MLEMPSLKINETKQPKQVDFMRFQAIYIKVIFLFISLTGLLQAQIKPFENFESGGNELCQCPASYTCYNDAGRVVDGVQSTYTPGNLGCVSYPYDNNHTHPLNAHSGIGYLYFYAGGDRLKTASKLFLGGEQIELCVWYCGPLGAGGTGQEKKAYFNFGLDSLRIGPRVFVPTGTLWTEYCYTVTMTAGKHNFSILSGDSADYAMWFDDWSIYDPCTVNTLHLGNDTSLCEGKSLTLGVGQKHTNFLWQDNSTNSSYTITKPGTYWVQLSTSCATQVDSIVVNYKECPCNIYIPNTFTPNHDELNDTFLPMANCDFVEYKFYILDRWGEKIFESNDTKHAWDGTYKGKLVENGDYVYFVKYKFENSNSQTKYGYISIMR